LRLLARLDLLTSVDADFVTDVSLCG
jgi:hypothetical protein